MKTSPRALTDGETAALRTLFGAAIDYDRVRLHCGWAGNPIALIAFANRNAAIALGRHIHIAGPWFRDDYADDPEAFSHFVAHEAVHVWQWTSGRFNPARYFWQYFTRPRHGYDISGVTAESRFEGLGYEQQAEVARTVAMGVHGLRPLLAQAYPGTGDFAQSSPASPAH